MVSASGGTKKKRSEWPRPLTSSRGSKSYGRPALYPKVSRDVWIAEPKTQRQEKCNITAKRAYTALDVAKQLAKKADRKQRHRDEEQDNLIRCQKRIESHIINSEGKSEKEANSLAKIDSTGVVKEEAEAAYVAEVKRIERVYQDELQAAEKKKARIEGLKIKGLSPS